MSIGELRRVLRDSGVLAEAGGEPTPAELADALWLAALRRSTRTAPEATRILPPAGDLPDADIPPGPASAAGLPGWPARPAADSNVRASLPLPRRASRGAPPAGVLVSAATRSQLPDPLSLARAMRPLRRRVPSPGRQVVDEELTADLRAEQRLWMPVLAPASEPAFDLMLVIDDSESMALWSELVREFELLCKQLGAFRDVRLWRLATGRAGDPGKPRLRGVSRASGLRDERELLDPTGRRLILVVTDGVHPGWQPSGPLRPILARWALASPLAIVQPFPQRLWHRSPLRPVTAEFRSGWPGRGPTVHDSSSVDVPILELTSKALGRWAGIISGTAGATSLAAATLPREPVADGEAVGNAPAGDADGAGPADPVRLVKDFRASVSPAAYRLAGYLSAVPLTLPVMRLVQESMMTETGPAELAEVFLSGLLRRSGQSDPAADAGSASYVFAEGVRDVLHGTLTRDEALRILDTVGAYLVRGRGAGRRFSVVLDSVPGEDDILAAADQYPEAFGRISGRLLERIGGPYAEAIQRKAALKAAVQEQSESREPERPPADPVSLPGGPGSEKRTDPWTAWERCEGRQDAEALSRLSGELPGFFANSTLVDSRWSRLPFYATHRLMELRFARDHTIARAFVLHGPKQTWWLNGDSGPMHDVNEAESLTLTQSTVCDYVRFFFYFLRNDNSDNSAFILIESADEIGPSPDSGERDEDHDEEITLEVARGTAKPLLMKGLDATGKFLVDATVAYDGSLFAASLAVDTGGNNEMIDDEPIVALGALAIPEVPSLGLEVPDEDPPGPVVPPGRYTGTRADIAELFVGRAAEQDVFRRVLDLTEGAASGPDEAHVILIYGPAGTGKSTLLSRLHEIAGKSQRGRRLVADIVDCDDERWVDPDDHSEPEGASAWRLLDRLYTAVRAGAAGRRQRSRVERAFKEFRQAIAARPEPERLDHLVGQFAQALKELSRDDGPVIMFIDTGELLRQRLERLRDAARRSGPKVVWVLGLRSEAESQADVGSAAARFRQGIHQDRLWSMPLGRFDDRTMEGYLRRRLGDGYPAGLDIEVMARLTHGIPLAVFQVGELLADGRDPRSILAPGRSGELSGVVMELTRRYLAHARSSPEFQPDLLLLCGLALLYHEDDRGGFRRDPSGRAGPDPSALAVLWDVRVQAVAARLGSLAERHDLLIGGDRRLHPEVRKSFLLFLLDPIERLAVRDMNVRAAALYRARAASAGHSTVDAQMADQGWRIAVIALLWHTFWVDLDNGLQMLDGLFAAAVVADKDFAAALLRVATFFAPASTPDGQRRIGNLQLVTDLQRMFGPSPDRRARATGAARDVVEALETCPADPLLATTPPASAYYDLLKASCYEALGLGVPDRAAILLRSASDVEAGGATARALASQVRELAVDVEGYRDAGAGAEQTIISAMRLRTRFDPDDADGHSSLGNTLLNLGRYDEAEASYREALRLDPGNAIYHYSLGGALSWFGRYDEAAAAYREALRLDASVADFHRDLGAALLGLGRFDEAEAAYREALRLDPDSSDVCNGLGYVLSCLGRYHEAVTTYREAVRLDSSFVNPHNGLGRVYLKLLGKIDEAAAALREALRLDPDYAAAHANLGSLYVITGDLGAARSSFLLAAQAVPPKHAFSELMLGALDRDADPSAAEEHFTAALASLDNPYRPFLLTPFERAEIRALALAALGRGEEAIAVFERAVSTRSSADVFQRQHYELFSASGLTTGITALTGIWRDIIARDSSAAGPWGGIVHLA